MKSVSLWAKCTISIPTIKKLAHLGHRPEAKAFRQMTDGMKYFLGAVGVVTLFLGGLGVMNVMMVAVRERTREIGVRKALGAPAHTILKQFFIEALLIAASAEALGWPLPSDSAAWWICCRCLLSLPDCCPPGDRDCWPAIAGVDRGAFGAISRAKSRVDRSHRSATIRSRRIQRWLCSFVSVVDSRALCGLSISWYYLCYSKSFAKPGSLCKRNYTRSLLTMLGIVWGIATVTLLIAYGSSFRPSWSAASTLLARRSHLLAAANQRTTRRQARRQEGCLRTGRPRHGQRNRAAGETCLP